MTCRITYQRIQDCLRNGLQLPIRLFFPVRINSFQLNPDPVKNAPNYYYYYYIYILLDIHEWRHHESDPTWIFSNIIDINFTFVFLIKSCLVTVLRCSLWRYISFSGEYFFWLKRIYVFEWSIFWLRICLSLPVDQSSFTSNSFRIRSCSYPKYFF
jgi:hypothetical protein